MNLRDTSSIHIRGRRLVNSRGDEAFLPSIVMLLATDLISVGLGTTLKTFLPPWMNPDSSTKPALRCDASKGSSKPEGIPTKKYNNYTLQGRIDSPSTIFLTPEKSLMQSSESSLQEKQQRQLPNKPYIKEIKGLPNRGQTCYANSIFQALASLYPILQYVEQYRGHNAQSHQYKFDRLQRSNEIVGSALFDTLSYINGHNVYNAHETTIKSASFKSTNLATKGFISTVLNSIKSSAFRPTKQRGDPQRVMDMVAQCHSQFRSRSSLRAGLTEQQDAHEFFSALMDVFSLQDGCGREKERGFDKIDLRTARFFEKGLASSGDILRYEKTRDSTFLWGQEYYLDRQNLSNPSLSQSGGHEFKDEEPAQGTEKFSNSGNAVNSEEILDPSESTKEFDERQEEKKHDENTIDYTVQEVLAQSCKPQSCKQEYSTQDMNETECKKNEPDRRSDSISFFDPIQNPFDGWSGSTIKCSICHHIRPIRSTPFLGLSLPIATIQSTFLQDFLAAEYGGFQQAEQVSDVQCMSCAIFKKINELEEENLLVTSAISSVQRRKRGRHASQQCNAGGIGYEKDDTNDDTSIAGLVKESQQIEKKIATLKAIDPDADDNEDDDDDSGQHNGLCGYYNIDDNCRSLNRMIPLRGNAYKASFLMRPPKVLCIHLQRRHYDMACDRMVKVMKHVDFPEVLDVSSYCAFTTNSFGQKNMNGSANDVNENLKKSSSTKNKILYKLMSVVEHKGNAFGGHYQTYRRTCIVDSFGDEGVPSPKREYQQEWALVSDESVALRTWADVRRCQAYMLFYVAIS